MTLQALEARRRNAQKSTGPRSAEGKRRVAQNLPGRQGLPASPVLAQDSQALLTELLEAFEPANPAERLLVGELVQLHWRKQCNREAQEGLIEKQLANLRRERSKHQRELTLESSDSPYRIAAAAGFFQMEDCPAKFRELSRLLNVLKDDIELGNFSDEGAELLRIIYGPSPSMRGARVLGNYKRLLASGLRPPPAEPQACPPAPQPDGADTGLTAAPTEDNSDAARAARLDRLSLESTRVGLLRAIQEEKSLLAAKYQSYLDEHIPSPAALERAALVPSEDAWYPLLRQDQALDRQIESKTRLLLFMQWVRRSTHSGTKALYRGHAKAKK
jgi:hypothetical protein